MDRITQKEAGNNNAILAGVKNKMDPTAMPNSLVFDV